MRKPSSYRADNGASTLKGCIPVRRISLGSRGSQLSGVFSSSFSMAIGGVDFGGRTNGSNALLSFRLLLLSVSEDSVL